MTIKWKITLSLVIVSLFLIISYFYTAQKIFQEDKISYIYENQQTKIDSLVSDFNKTIEDALSQSRFFAKEFAASGSLGSDTLELFSSQKLLIGIYLLDQGILSEIVLKKDAPRLDIKSYFGKFNLKKVDVVHVQNDVFLINFPTTGNTVKNLILLASFHLPSEELSTMQYFFLEKTSVIGSFGAKYIALESAAKIIDNSPSNGDTVASQTSRLKIENDYFLTTSSATKFGDLKFVSLIKEKEALHVLDELFRKSILYLIISILLTFIVSLILSHRLTFGMRKLTLVAEEIGKGDFDVPIDFESTDEVGILAKAFKKMAREIKELFSQKIEKDRMERELQTASVIQERLFPSDDTVRFKDFLLSGYYDTSTECGGDWWHYYQSGFDLYFMIADTTGHGIPAALITAASNSIFSHIKNENFSLEKIIQVWDEAVYQSSKGEFFMTAQLVRINLATGDAELINLGHELPILYKTSNSKAQFLVVPKNFSLGERQQSPAQVYTFNLDHGDQLLLYSDGVLAMMSDDSNEYSDKQFLKRINAFFSKDTYGEGTATEVFNYLKEHSKRTLPGFEDDITLVRISRGS